MSKRYYNRIFSIIAILLLTSFKFISLSNAQEIEYNNRLSLNNYSTLIRKVFVEGDSLLLVGEIGSDSSGLQGVFILKTDTIGNLGTVKYFRDPKHIDQLLLSSSHSSINHNDSLIFAGDILYKSNNYFIVYIKKTNTFIYKEYNADFLVRFTETIIAFNQAFYLIGFVQTQNFDLDIFIQKLDLSGNKIWEKTYGVPSKDETGRAVIIEDDGLAIMSSESFDNTPTIKNDTRYWIRFMHVDTSGAIVRDWREEVTGEEGWSGSLVKFNNDYIYTTNLLGEEYGFGYFQAGQVVRRDQDFNLVWRRPYGAPDNYFNGLGDMIISADSNLLLTGQILDESQKYVLQRILKICPDGEVIWELRDTGLILNNGESLNFMEGIAASTCNSTYAVGYTYVSAGFYEGLLLKVTGDGCIDTLCTTTDIEDLIALHTNKVNIYPNPADDELTIKLSHEFPSLATAQIYDLTGRLLQTLILNKDQHTISLINYPEGMYLLNISKEGLILISRKILKH